MPGLYGYMLLGRIADLACCYSWSSMVCQSRLWTLQKQLNLLWSRWDKERWWSRSSHVNGQFFPEHVRWLIYWKRLSRGQNRCGVDAECGVLDRCTLAPSGKYDWTVRVLRRCGLCHITLTTYCMYSVGIYYTCAWFAWLKSCNGLIFWLVWTN